MDTLESMRRKIEGAGDLKSIVKTMKAMAASNIGQYEMAVSSLNDYYHTLALGIIAYFKQKDIDSIKEKKQSKNKKEHITCAIVFGSDQGLVGQFNDVLTNLVASTFNPLPGKKEVWAIGERVQLHLADVGLKPLKVFTVPTSVGAITPLVSQILLKCEEGHENGNMKEFYIFHNQPLPGAGYAPVSQRFLPLDEKWRSNLAELRWPTKILPRVAGGIKSTLAALIHEYLFVSLFRACAESLASENASRLQAMQRAEKNIGDLLDELGHKFHSLRQSSIDEELFDVISGFESLKNKNR